MLTRRELLLLLGAAGAVPLARAQTGPYPSRPIRIIVATIPGSGPDIAVRKMTPLLAETIRQPFVVDNKPGGNGIIATVELMKSPHDGYTLLNANIGNALNDILRPGSGPRMFEDLLPVTDLTAGALMLLVNNELPVRTAKELVDYAKARPGVLNYGSGGPGSLIQLTGERRSLATASARTLPLRTCCSISDHGVKPTCTWPATRSTMSAPNERYGTSRMSMPAASFTRSPVSWIKLPGPPEP